MKTMAEYREAAVREKERLVKELSRAIARIAMIDVLEGPGFEDIRAAIEMDEVVLSHATPCPRCQRIVERIERDVENPMVHIGTAVHNGLRDILSDAKRIAAGGDDE